MQHCRTSGLLAIAAAVILGIGLTRDQNNTRRATRAWKFIDAGAQLISLILAYQLISGPNVLATAVGIALVLIAGVVGYGHYANVKNTSSFWNYPDGADYALWTVVFIWDLILLTVYGNK